MTGSQEVGVQIAGEEAARHETHAIMACLNRRTRTIRTTHEVNLASEASAATNAKLSIALMNNGSTDGAANFLDWGGIPIQVVSGRGSAFSAPGLPEARAHFFNAASYLKW